MLSSSSGRVVTGHSSRKIMMRALHRRSGADIGTICHHGLRCSETKHDHKLTMSQERSRMPLPTKVQRPEASYAARARPFTPLETRQENVGAPSPAVPRLKSENDVLLAMPFGDQEDSARAPLASGCVRLFRIRFTKRDIASTLSFGFSISCQRAVVHSLPRFALDAGLYLDV